MSVTDETLTPEWVAAEFEREGYEGRMSLRTTAGALQVMERYLRDNKMKISNLTNDERWRRIVRDSVPSEMHLASPAHYHGIPRQFITRMDFLQHHYATAFAFFHSVQFQIFLAAVVMTLAHDWSHQLYTKPLPLLGSTVSCSKLPVQYFCPILKSIQDYTFSGFEDLTKFITAVVLQKSIGLFARVLVPVR